MKIVTAALCALTILAVAYLSVSVIALRPPRANYPAWGAFAALVTVQSVATLLAMVAPVAWLRAGTIAGGAVLAAAGVWMVRGTLTSAHFEGYALVLGAMLVAQGIVTIVLFARQYEVISTKSEVRSSSE
jgi:hypothetical protein